MLFNICSFSQAQTSLQEKIDKYDNVREDIKKMSRPSLNINSFNQWSSVNQPAISNNGNYFLYTIDNQPVGGRTLVVQTLKGDWKREIIGASNPSFTNDSRKVVFIINDSLCLLTLGSSSIESVAQVSYFSFFTMAKKEWLVYQVNTVDKELVLHNFTANNKLRFKDVEEYLMCEDGSALILKVRFGKGKSRC